ALEHPMHVPNGRSQNVNAYGFNELLRLNRGCQSTGQVRSSFVYFRTASDVTQLSLHKDGRIDSFEGFYRLFGLTQVLLERQSGSVTDNSIKSCPGRFDSLCQ